MRSIRMAAAVLLSAAWLAGCSGGEGERPASESRPAEAASEEMEAPESERGPVDEALAAKGEAMMQAKGCTACHTVGGGRLVGPDLAGVTERRSDAFIVGMIVNPDSMLANDETARQLLAEHFTPMANQGVSEEDARAFLAYFRSRDEE